MKLGSQLKTLSHHAYYLVGPNSLSTELKTILEKTHKISSQGNPDFFDRSYETFTIDDARELKELHGMRPVHHSGKKIFILAMNGITVEAQNALLKLLEEPSEHAHFFLILPSAHLLLPTIKSRISFLENESEEGGNVQEAEKFLKLSPAKRLDAVKKLIDEISKEKKTRQDAIQLLNDIESAVYSKGVKEGKDILEKIDKARAYMNDRAPSVKMLLEYVALNV